MVLPLATDDQLRLSEAVCRGTVTGVESYRDPADGLIYSRATLQVDETFKGKFPPMVTLVHHGGELDGISQMDGFNPQLKAGEERVLFLSRRADGRLFATQGGASALKLRRGQAGFDPDSESLLRELRVKSKQGRMPGSDVTDQAASSASSAQASTGPIASGPLSSVTGLLLDGNLLASRFLLPDRGEPIPYLVDADTLPAGMTLDQALGAVRQAFAAWAAVTSLKFTFEGLQSFQKSSAVMTNQDGKIRIQLHDAYHYLSPLNGFGPNTLGVGGRFAFTFILTPANWSMGGNVNGNEFNQSSSGFVVLQHTNVVMQVLSTFAEVLCHEVGHVLSMAHSSENPNETNAVLREAIMYYRAHADGRGAMLGSYDPPVIEQAYPQTNTPPYCFSRVMDIVTHPLGSPDIPGINEVQLRGYDLQSSILTLAVTNATVFHGTFSVFGRLVKYSTPQYASAPRVDPAGTRFYDQMFARYSDGPNASPFVSVRVISFLDDSFPDTGSDGIPDAWMTTYFGDPDPALSSNSGAYDDFDGDGFTNLQEFILGSDPTLADSNLRITSFDLKTLQFQAKPYELYEVYGSTNLLTWRRAINPIVPTAAPAVATGYTNGAGRQFFRVLKVP
jgi:hypothetical protein